MAMHAKEIFSLLLTGHSIAGYGKYGYRLRTPDGCPIARIHQHSFEHFKYLVLRQAKNRMWIIDKRKVRSLHGNHICKKLYKEMRNAKNIQPTAGK